MTAVKALRVEPKSFSFFVCYVFPPSFLISVSFVFPLADVGWVRRDSADVYHLADVVPSEVILRLLDSLRWREGVVWADVGCVGGELGRPSQRRCYTF